MKFFRSRLIIHLAGSVMVSEIVLSLTQLMGLSGKSLIFYSAIAAPLVGIISEIRDMIYEHDYKDKWVKHVADILSWCFGGCIFIALELLQFSS